MRRPKTTAMILRKRDVHPDDWVDPKIIAIFVPARVVKLDTLPPPRKRRNRNSK